MKKSNRFLLISLIVNFLLLLAVIISTYYMFLTTSDGVYEDTGFGLLKFFSIDSSVYLGFVLLLVIPFQIVSLLKRKNIIPQFVNVIYFSGVVSCLITMLIVIFYIAPGDVKQGLSFFNTFSGPLFSFHIVVPVVSTLNFSLFMLEPRFFKRFIPCGFVPIGIYFVFYVINYFTKSIPTIMYGEKNYDWYEFFTGNVWKTILIISIMAVGLSAACVVLYFLNKLARIKFVGYYADEGTLYCPEEDSMEAEIVSDEILGKVSCNFDVLIDDNANLDGTITYRYVTDTGTIHVVKKKAKKNNPVSLSGAFYSYHICKKRKHKWVCVEQTVPWEFNCYYFESKDEALKNALILSKKNEGIIKIH